MKLKKYKKDDLISYSFGAFPTMELIKNRCSMVDRILIHSSFKNMDVLNEMKKYIDESKIEYDKDKEIEKCESEKKKLEMLQEKVKFNAENLKLNLLEEESKGLNDEKNDFDVDNNNLKINDNSAKDNKEEKIEDEYSDWVFYKEEEAESIVNDTDYQKDLLDEYEIIENYDENDQQVATSKKIEV